MDIGSRFVAILIFQHLVPRSGNLPRESDLDSITDWILRVYCVPVKAYFCIVVRQQYVQLTNIS
jgi:hypothetical protein